MRTDDPGIKLIDRTIGAFILIVIGLTVWHLSHKWETATLRNDSTLPKTVIEVPYADSMELGKKVLYNGKTWTVIRIE